MTTPELSHTAVPYSSTTEYSREEPGRPADINQTRALVGRPCRSFGRLMHRGGGGGAASSRSGDVPRRLAAPGQPGRALNPHHGLRHGVGHVHSSENPGALTPRAVSRAWMRPCAVSLRRAAVCAALARRRVLVGEPARAPPGRALGRLLACVPQVSPPCPSKCRSRVASTNT